MCFVNFVEFRFTLLNILSCFLFTSTLSTEAARRSMFSLHTKKYVSTTILIFYCVLANFFLFFRVKFCFRVSLSTHFSLSLYTQIRDLWSIYKSDTPGAAALHIYLFFIFFFFLLFVHLTIWWKDDNLTLKKEFRDGPHSQIF